jgi:hypothetical protein
MGGTYITHGGEKCLQNFGQKTCRGFMWPGQGPVAEACKNMVLKFRVPYKVGHFLTICYILTNLAPWNRLVK